MGALADLDWEDICETGAVTLLPTSLYFFTKSLPEGEQAHSAPTQRVPQVPGPQDTFEGEKREFCTDGGGSCDKWQAEQRAATTSAR